MEEYTLDVEGMSCTGCEERVTNAAKQVDGIHRAEADYETGTVKITGESDSEDAVRESIYDAGYDVPA